jgi:hypothetical protein
MPVQHKLGPKLEKAANHQSTNCYTKYRKELMKTFQEIHHSLENASATSGEKITCHGLAAAQSCYTTKSVPLSATN